MPLKQVRTAPATKPSKRPAYFEVAAVLPRVSQELGLFKSVAEAAQRMAENIARDILQNGSDPLEHIRELDTLEFEGVD
jgi:hypothetical protein